jgi:carboxylesterase 2
LNLFRKTRDWTDLDRQLAETMSNALVAFASGGNPNTSGQNDWPKYRGDREEVRELGTSNRAVPWPDSARMDFFAAQSASRVGEDTRPVPGRNRD